MAKKTTKPAVETPVIKEQPMYSAVEIISAHDRFGASRTVAKAALIDAGVINGRLTADEAKKIITKYINKEEK